MKFAYAFAPPFRILTLPSPWAIAVWLLLLCCVSTLQAETVRVATYNLRNYLLTDRMVDGFYRTDYPKPEKEKAAVRAILKAAQADIVAIQEIGSMVFLQELQSDLLAYGMDYPHLALMKGADKERHTAVISKKPIAQIVEHKELDFKYFKSREVVKRGLLEVIFENNGEQWHLYVVHLKSRWTNREDDQESSIRRVREAEAIRRHLLKSHPPESHARYLLMGDFNDHRASATVKRFITMGKKPFLELVPTFDSRDETWTYFYKKEERYERVDFIFASPWMMPAIVDGSGDIIDQQPETSLASDHRLLYVDLKFD